MGKISVKLFLIWISGLDVSSSGHFAQQSRTFAQFW